MLNEQYRQELIKKFSPDEEDRLLAARIIDKYNATERKNVPQNTRFLTTRESTLAKPLLDRLGARYIMWGGYEEAERVCAIFVPDYMEYEQAKSEPVSPLAVIRARFAPDAGLTHRDFLGALMSMGVERDTLGDIIPRESDCDIVILREILPFMLSGFDRVGKVRVTPETVPFAEGKPAQFKLIRDTVASLRLDAVVAAGFSMSREKSAEAIRAGRVAVDGMEAMKADRMLSGGERISVRGLGKAELSNIGGQSRKGRTIIEIKKFV